jgi:hypothetical protein
MVYHPPRKKRFTYADRVGRSQREHAAHWLGFTFEAGPVIVSAEGIWGGCQVWAASRAEGQRVIRHGLVFGGFDPDDERQGVWRFAVASDGRNGQGGVFETANGRCGVLVSKRDGPDGAPVAEFFPDPTGPSGGDP